MDAVDGVANEVRSYRMAEYVFEHYQPCLQFERYELWSDSRSFCSKAKALADDQLKVAQSPFIVESAEPQQMVQNLRLLQLPLLLQSLSLLLLLLPQLLLFYSHHQSLLPLLLQLLLQLLPQCRLLPHLQCCLRLLHRVVVMLHLMLRRHLPSSSSSLLLRLCSRLLPKLSQLRPQLRLLWPLLRPPLHL